MTDLNTYFRLNGHSFSDVTAVLDFCKKELPDIHPFLNEWFDEKHFVNVRTSGSTGTPKVIRLKKRQMIASAEATGNFFDLGENTTALLCMPVTYIAGKMMLVRAMVLGWHLDVVKPVTTPFKNIQKTYDFSAVVPLQLHHSIGDLDKVRKLIVGGGAVSGAFAEKIKDVSTDIYATYGMTETITHIAVKRLNGSIPEEAYRCLPGVFISVDERGCLVIEAPNISDTKIVTNDLVEPVSETQFIWKGRFDNVINSGGVKLIPEQIEKKLEPILNQRFFVAGLPDDELGERLVLILEGKEFPVDRAELKKRLDRFEVPKAIFFISEFAETGSGKVNRKQTLKNLNNNRV